MAITLSCPDCGENYELEDSMAGKKAACACGAVLCVPKEVDLPEGQIHCPGCSSAVNDDTVLCINCGYNFQTGGRMRSAESRVEPEVNQGMMLFRRLIKPCVILIILLISALIVYNLFFVKHYGISLSSPLGTYSKIRAHLEKIGFELEASKEKPPEIFGNDATKVLLKDVELAKINKGLFPEEAVFVILSSTDGVLAVGGNFKGGSKSIPGDTGTRTGRFLSSFWKDIGAPLPEYKQIEVDKGFYKTTYNQATFALGDVCAVWTEFPEEITIIPNSNDMIITLSKYESCKYSDVQNGLSFEELFKKDKDKEKEKQESK